MEGSIFNEQRVIWTKSNIFWTMQFTKNIPKDDEQYFPRAFTWRSTSQLYRQLCYTYENQERTWRKDNMILENSRKA